MTLKQKQALLAYLDYYDGQLDGLWGEKSQRATIDFQRAYMEQTEVDGIFGAATEKRILEVIATGEKPKQESVQIDTAAPGWWKDIRYFTRAEFRCPCGKCGGFPVEPDEKLVRTVDAIRAKLGKPITINSGVRCQEHNDELPGSAKNSYHLKGMAADLHCNTATPAEMKAAAEAVMGKTGGIGLYSWGIHVDVGKYSRWNG
ncbi:MAG: D-Ala-D-Ala carboxypeptidase family metallohydrolase [Clostridiales bacterium]|nr:D-Ala-D-Ala carboxypeptidase family metallohydrolase [Clostridiales bacterium]